mmetsp:Transcript_44840/g.116113  ORF Transcript_44840/g.116113 Transcript_44840/m.116113 type:complete len:232 (+) Transcript_44840:109-804(+)
MQAPASGPSLHVLLRQDGVVLRATEVAEPDLRVAGGPPLHACLGDDLRVEPVETLQDEGLCLIVCRGRVGRLTIRLGLLGVHRLRAHVVADGAAPGLAGRLAEPLVDAVHVEAVTAEEDDLRRRGLVGDGLNAVRAQREVALPLAEGLVHALHLALARVEVRAVAPAGRSVVHATHQQQRYGQRDRADDHVEEHVSTQGRHSLGVEAEAAMIQDLIALHTRSWAIHEGRGR